MTRILVLSDSHGSRRRVDLALEQQPEANVIFHLGDGWDDLEYARAEYPEKVFYQVRGNCDGWCDLPDEEEVSILEHRFLLTHGHLYRVKQTDRLLLGRGRALDVSMVLYGHTHRPESGWEDGLFYMNPGSLRDGNYGVIDITAKGIVPNLCKLRDSVG